MELHLTNNIVLIAEITTKVKAIADRTGQMVILLGRGEGKVTHDPKLVRCWLVLVIGS